MKSLKISVVTVCYNAQNEIEETILSIINQTYDNVEFIIIDGGSTDGTCDIIKKYQNRIAYFVSEPDKGIYDAMNKGLDNCTGSWVIFMNAGDTFANNNVISNFPYDSRYLAMYGNAIYIERTGLRLRKGQKENVVYRDMPNTHQTFFVKTEEAKKVKFDIKYKFSADYNMIYQFYLRCGVACLKYVDMDICYYNVKDGFSIKHPNEVFGETIQIRKPGLIRNYDYAKFLIKKYILNKK